MIRYKLFILTFAVIVSSSIMIYNFRVLDPLLDLGYRYDYCNGITGGTEVSFYRHYFNLDGLVELASKADVIIYGNSRSLLGLSVFFDNKLKEKYNLKVLYLSQGHGERGEYLYRFLSKHEIKNKLFLLNVDRFFFRKGLSNMAAEALGKSMKEVNRAVISANLRWQFINAIDIIIPIEITSRLLIRNIDNEAWLHYSGEPKGHYPIQYKEGIDGVIDSEIKFSHDLINLLKTYNNEIIFIGVPAHGISYKTIQYFAELNNVDYLVNPIPDMYTNDESHLDTDSAEKYSNWLFSALEPKLLVLKNEKDEKREQRF